MEVFTEVNGMTTNTWVGGWVLEAFLPPVALCHHYYKAFFVQFLLQVGPSLLAEYPLYPRLDFTRSRGTATVLETKINM